MQGDEHSRSDGDRGLPGEGELDEFGNEDLSSGRPSKRYEGPPTSDDRTLALLCHLGGVLLSFLVPLIIWLIKKDQSAFVDDQGKEALNFQLTLLIGYAIAGVSACFIVGLILAPIIWVLSLAFGIMGAIAASKGEKYRYPINIRFIH